MSVVVGLDYERLTVHCLMGEPTLGWRDLSVIFGHVLETARCSDRGSIHAWRAMSVISGLVMKSFTVMTWTPDSIETCRDMSVIFGHVLETKRCSDRDSIHAWRDMIVKKPAVLIVTHGAPFIRRSDSRLAGYELQESAPYDGSPGELFDERALRLAGYERQ